jgi:hypothetical protein
MPLQRLSIAHRLGDQSPPAFRLSYTPLGFRRTNRRFVAQRSPRCPADWTRRSSPKFRSSALSNYATSTPLISMPAETASFRAVSQCEHAVLSLFAAQVLRPATKSRTNLREIANVRRLAGRTKRRRPGRPTARCVTSGPTSFSTNRLARDIRLIGRRSGLRCGLQWDCGVAGPTPNAVEGDSCSGAEGGKVRYRCHGAAWGGTNLRSKGETQT